MPGPESSISISDLDASIDHETERSSSFVEIHPDRKTTTDFLKIKPKYTIDSILFLTASAQSGNADFTKSTWRIKGYSVRNPQLEKSGKNDFFDELKHTPKELADLNFAEMERATALKWYLSMGRILHDSKITKIPTRQPGRVSVAIPGCNLGFEIGRVLDFFNEQGIPVDVDACDIGAAGAEQGFIKIPERTAARGSTVSIAENVDARTHYAGKKSDLAIIRHPGPLFFPDQVRDWQAIIQSILDTNPSVVFVSTYNHEIEDDELGEMYGKGQHDRLYEGEIVQKFLEANGYLCPESAFRMDDLLQYPHSIYMVAAENLDGKKLRFQMPVDCEIFAAYSPEILKLNDVSLAS